VSSRWWDLHGVFPCPRGPKPDASVRGWPHVRAPADPTHIAAAAYVTTWIRPEPPAPVGWPPPDPAAGEFHRSLPGYVPTPVVDLPGLAAELGVGRVVVKDESARFDLGAFKYLGAAWATFRAVAERSGFTGGHNLADLRAHLARGASVTLVTATDGNHGRAVARTARLLGLPAAVFVPEVVPPVVITRITHEGADLTVVAGDYDTAVATASAAADANPHAILVQDTAWEGYERIPAWIVDGYGTLCVEMDAQLAALGTRADAALVPVGVGSLAQAVLLHYAGTGARVISVEPDTAACVLASMQSGALTSVATAGTVMNGLNCGTPSSIAWPYLKRGLAGAVAVTDEQDSDAMSLLAAGGLSIGPSGAASVAGARVLLAGDGADERRAALGLDRNSTIVCICTEGALE